MPTLNRIFYIYTLPFNNVIIFFNSDFYFQRTSSPVTAAGSTNQPGTSNFEFTLNGAPRRGEQESTPGRSSTPRPATTPILRNTDISTLGMLNFSLIFLMDCSIICGDV